MFTVFILGFISGSILMPIIVGFISGEIRSHKLKSKAKQSSAGVQIGTIHIPDDIDIPNMVDIPDDIDIT